MFIPENDMVSLKEGNNMAVDFVVVSDPALDTQSGHLLSKEGGGLCEDHVFLQGKKIHLRNVQRSDAGIYFVSSFNAAGEGKASFKLRVKSE